MAKTANPLAEKGTGLEWYEHTRNVIKILMVSTSYPTSASDWKGIFIRNIIQALAARGDLDISVWQPAGPIPKNVYTACSPSDQLWLDRLMQIGGIAHALRNRPVLGPGLAIQLLFRLRRMYFRCNDVHLRHVNWLQNALPVPADRKPLVVSVLGTDMAMLKIHGVAPLLRKVFRGRETRICPNATWMVPDLERQFGGVATIVYLPFGIDPGWYEIERSEWRQGQWLCVSRLTPGKIGPLFEWGEQLFTETDAELHLFGPNQTGMKIPNWVHYHGSVRPDELRERWFPSATGLITLSRHSEGRPQVMLEAMASGLPILATDLAAHGDFLEHGQTGWLCSDQASFKEGISSLSGPEMNRKIGVAARTAVRQSSGTWETFSDRLMTIYRSVIQ